MKIHGKNESVENMKALMSHNLYLMFRHHHRHTSISKSKLQQLCLKHTHKLFLENTEKVQNEYHREPFQRYKLFKKIAKANELSTNVSS